MSALAGLARAGADLLVRKDGPLTRELLLTPGKFGLGRVPSRLAPDATTTLVCGFCSTGCGLTAHLRNGEALNLSPSTEYPVNMGMACPKGWEALSPLAGPGRGVSPLVKRNGRLVEATWQDAVTEMARRFKAIQERHGAASVAWIGTGQMVTEELLFLGALGKLGMGMQHGDSNTRQCMATSAVAYKQAFGFDAPPYTYKDLEESDVIVLIGSNLCIAHPILWERVYRNPHRPKIVVVDPRRTETAMAATHHYAIRPKSDLSFLYAVANELIQRGWVDREYVDAHTSGYAELAAHVSGFTRESVAETCGIPAERITELARMIHEGKRVSLWWTMGVNQSHQGVRTAQAIMALALLTGNIGRPGTGANSVTGQCNAMGSRLFSNTSSLFCGRDPGSPEDRADVARILGIPVENVSDRPSLAYDQILDGILSKKIKGLWILGTNPAHSWINQGFLHEVLSRLECLVVQDMYSDTETASRADIFFPAAGWGEKEGTLINSERRIGVVKKVRRAPGQALADFHIFQLVAEAWGVGKLFRRFASPEETFDVMKELSRGTPCDFSGIADYVAIDRAGGIQWPYPESAPPGGHERRLFEDGRYFTKDGRAKFLFDPPRPMPETPNAEYPFILLTGRGSSSQWHTETRSRRSAVLRRLSPTELHLEISPPDAAALNLSPGERVDVVSRRGQVTACAFITPSVRPGEVFLPMHHPGTNQLTFAAFDPHSRQPAYKGCAVKVHKVP